MARSNVEILRSGLERINSGDLDVLEEMIDPGFEMSAPQFLDASKARNRDDLRNLFTTFGEVFTDLRFEPEEIVALDDATVLAPVRTSGRAQGSGVDIDQLIVHVWTFRDGRAVKLVTYLSKDEALAAFGRSG